MTIGLNILTNFVSDMQALRHHVAESKARVHLVMDDLAFATSLARQYPEKMIIHRMYHPDDAYFWKTIDPVTYANSLPRFDLPRGNLVHQVMNEPSGYLSGFDLQRFIDWCITVMRVSFERSVPICLPNWAVGHPSETLMNNGEYDRLLRAMSLYAPFVTLGIHEYFRSYPLDSTNNPYLTGRVVFILNAYKRLELTPPRIVVTEYGRDVAGNKDGWKTWPSNATTYAQLLVQGMSNYTALSTPYPIDVCVFCYGRGANNDWETYDIEGQSVILNAMTAYNASVPEVTPTPPVVPPPVVPPPVVPPPVATPVIPLPEDESDWLTAVLHAPGQYVNFRKSPSLSAEIIKRIYTRQTIEYIDPVVENNNYKWRLVRYNDQVGYVALVSPSWDDQFKSPVMVEKLINNVPYYSQHANGALLFRNDCGPACVRMVIGHKLLQRGFERDFSYLKVDDISRQMGKTTTGFATVSMLLATLDGYSIEANYLRFPLVQQAEDAIMASINAGQPVIALIQYGHLLDRQDKAFAGGHFVLVVGYSSDHYVLHDPAWFGNRIDEGAFWIVPHDQFRKALSQTEIAGNLPNQIIVVS